MDGFENTVMSNEEITMNPVDAGDDFSTDALPTEDGQQGTPDQTVDDSGVDGPAQGEDAQKDIGAAFAAERRRIEARERARYEQMLQSDPARTVGHRMLTDLMHRQGITMEQAVQMAETSFIRAFAEREGVTENVARMMISNMQQRQAAQQPTGAPDINTRAAQIQQELATVELPHGFDFDEAIKDEEFAQMLVDGAPVRVAASVYMRLAQANQRAAQAPQQIADKLKARQGLPQPVKPQQPANPQLDPYALSDEQILQHRQQRMKQR